MKNIELVLLGFFLVAILLMTRAADQNTAATMTGNGRASLFSPVK